VKPISDFTPSLDLKRRSLLEKLLQQEKAGLPASSVIARTATSAGSSLSFAQERLWFLDQLEPNSHLYNVPLGLRLDGELDAGALQRSLGEVVRRHEALRTCFKSVAGIPVQVPENVDGVGMPVVDLSELPEHERAAEVTRLGRLEAQRSFDLRQALKLRATLFRLTSTQHLLLLNLHHISADGWSIGVLVRELGSLYEAFSSGRPSSLAELPIQYADFAVWQREWLQGEVLETQLGYWKELLKGAPALLELPTERPRPASQSYRGATEAAVFPQLLLRELEALSRKEGASLFMTLLAAFQTLLGRYSGQEDIPVGSPIAGRHRVEVEGLIGFFVNMLVLRGDLSGNPTFRELLGRVREVALAAYAHQDLPFERLVQELQPERNLSYSPLFQILFALQNIPSESAKLGALNVSLQFIDSGTSKFDLSVEMTAGPEGLTALVEYATDLFDRDTILRLLDHFRVLLEGIVADPDQRIMALPLLTEAERRRLLVEWNETKTDYPAEASIQELFEAQARRTPEAVALEYEGLRLTYRELNARANQLASYLGRHGVGPEVRVGICAERSLEMVVGTLGILKAGGAYVPLDPDYPASRLSFMLEDTAAPVLLTQARLRDRLPAYAGRTVSLDADWREIAREGEENPKVKVGARNLAYVIYTSGSTGKPKGTCIEHRSVVRLVKNTNYVELGPQEVLLQFAPISFDASTLELWGSLLNGARLVVAPAGLLSLQELGRVIKERGVTTLWLTAALFHQMVDEQIESLRGVRQLLAGGETLSASHVRRMLEVIGSNRLINGYGPTENTTFTCCHLMTAESRIEQTVPIGRPISNTRVYVLDRHRQPVPDGVYGELYIGGDGLAREYLNQAELTAEKFVPDPFSGEAGARLYRTGDVVRYRKDRCIEFLGRVDHQVKIRGYRIELGEIEATLQQHPAIRQVVVLAREDVPGDKRLVAYLVAENPPSDLANQLRALLRESLPEYMVPAHFITLDALPLTPVGKVDRAALPVPDLSTGAATTYVAPRTPTEEILAGTWAQVLGLQRVGTEDNFFDLGGHSLLAMQVVSRVRQALGVELPLRDLFAAPTVLRLAARIEALRAEARPAFAVPALQAAAEDGPAELSFAQQRLWVLDQIQPSGAAYVMADAVEMSGMLDVRALEQALGALVERHESLRTVFVSEEGRPRQVVSESGRWSLPVVDLSGKSDASGELKALLSQEAGRGFDLSRGPLFRARLYRLAPEIHVLSLAMHHIISDGWSLGTLMRELGELYARACHGEAAILPGPRLQYRDFARWQRSWLRGDVLEGMVSRWCARLAGAPQVLELPTDRPRPAIESSRGAAYSFTLPGVLTERLRALSRREGATLFMTLFAGFALLLSRYSGQQDILVGTPVANRNRAEVEDVVGFFVNTLVLRADLSGDLSVREAIARVREMCLDAYAHQDLPFERLVEGMQPPRDLSRNPLFQVMFALQNAPRRTLQLPGLSLSPVTVNDGAAQFDLTLMVRETDEGLTGMFSYATDLFDGATIARMAAHWHSLLEAMAGMPECRVEALPLLTKAERHRILVEWNATEREYEVEARLHRLIEAQVAHSRDRVALEFEGRQLSYGQLNARANQLARMLRKKGVGPDVLVGVLAERSFDMVLALLAVLKAGGAYVPLDPSYPQGRLSHMLEDARARLVLAQPELVSQLPPSAGEVLVLDPSWAAYAQESGEDLDDQGTPEDLAYVIFTSGSTGRPKGGMNTHRGICNRLLWMQQEYRLGGEDRVMQKTPFSFDVSVWEFFWPLMTGARLVIALPEAHKDGGYLVRLIRESGITTMHFVPSMLRVFLEEARLGDCRSLRRVICSGEALPHELQERFFARLPGVELHNLYGPTEAAVDVSSWACRPGDERPIVPIGRPVANTQLYVLDKRLQPVPIGVPGELYIGGVQVGRGYVGRPDLSAERFVPDPFSRRPGGRLYRTGDLARHLQDGEIDYLGRVDFQVKIRGYRIELGEIEALLDKHPGVGQSVVVACGDQGEQQLLAYVVPRQAALAAEPLKDHLARTLPKYMIPGAFVFLDQLPLTSSGKVDRKRLPAPARAIPQQVQLSPRSPTEEVVMGTFRSVLERADFGVLDSFFELGGHSLTAARLMSKLRTTSGIDLPLRQLFERPTVAALAEAIDGLSWLERSRTPARGAGSREEIEL